MIRRPERRRRACLLLAVAAFLVADPPPAAARAGAAPTVRELVEVADIEYLSVSPDGRRVAFRVQQASIERNSYRLGWHIADLSTGEVRLVADGGAPIYTNGQIEGEPAVWSPDGRHIFHRALIDGAIGIRRTAVDGSGSRLVVVGDSDVERLEASPDGRSIVFVTGPRSIRRAVSHARQYSLDSTFATGTPSARTASPMRRAVARPSEESWRISAGSQLAHSPAVSTRSSWPQSVSAWRK